MAAVLENFVPHPLMLEFLSFWLTMLSRLRGVDATPACHALVQNPKIPTRISETLAAYCLLLSGNAGPGARLVRGGIADICMYRPIGLTKVEVKATGPGNFQTFGPKDYNCDLLVWIRFDNIDQLRADGRLLASLVPAPGRFTRHLGPRVNYSKLEQTMSANNCPVDKHEFKIADLINAT